MEAIKEAYSIFTDAWRFYRKYWEISAEDEYWDNLMRESNKMCEKNSSPLLRGLLGEIIKDIERRYKGK